MPSDEIDADYHSAGFNRTSGFGRSAAVVMVDMCRAYFEPDSPLFLDRPDVADECRRLVAAARQAERPVFWTRVEYEPGGADGGVWYRKVAALSCFDRGNPLGDWLEGLQPAEGDVVITKQHASGFFGTDLAESLRRADVDTVIVAGVSTSGCVRATATDASASGFVPIVAREACGDRNDRVNEANLFDLNAKYADVVTMDDVLQHLTRQTR